MRLFESNNENVVVAFAIDVTESVVVDSDQLHNVQCFC